MKGFIHGGRAGKQGLALNEHLAEQEPQPRPMDVLRFYDRIDDNEVDLT